MPKLPDFFDSLGPQVGHVAATLPLAHTHKRANTVVQGIIPTYYRVDGPTSGTVVGIVLGSVLGFLLLIWLFYSLANINNGRPNGASNAIAGEEEIVVRRRRNSHSHAGGRSRRSTRTEVREYSPAPPRSPRRRDPPVIVEERRQPRETRSRSRGFVVEERSRSRSRVPGDDVVEVIEEHDEDYRSRRGSTRRY